MCCVSERSSLPHSLAMQWSPRSATDFLVADGTRAQLFRCTTAPSCSEDAPHSALACTLLATHPTPTFVCHNSPHPLLLFLPLCVPSRALLKCGAFCPTRPYVALGATAGGTVEIVAESELGAPRAKTHRLELRVAPDPDDTQCTALAWSPSNDAHLAAAY